MLTKALLAVALGVALLGAGCFSGTPSNSVSADLSSQENVAYLENNGSTSTIFLSTVNGAGSWGYMEWPDSSERFSSPREGDYYSVKRPASSGNDETRRFSFSNDGRYIVVSPGGTGIISKPLVISAKGNKVWHLPAGAISPTFSPDSSKIAFYRPEAPGKQPNQVAVFDLNTGEERILHIGREPLAASWLDNQTLVFTDTGGPGVKEGIHSVFSLDVSRGAVNNLTPADRDFFYYAPPVSFVRSKIALMEYKWTFNIWSLDLSTGRLKQVTNNARYKQKATYLPGTSVILFQEAPQGADTRTFSDLFTINDDGRDLSIIVNDYFFFSGLYTVSLTSGKIAYQHVENGETAVWVSNTDGTGKTRISSSPSSWVGDPNFAPVASWQRVNPFNMSLDIGLSRDIPTTISVANPTGEVQEAVLRLFPGASLELSPATGSVADFILSADRMELPLTLEPGESRQVEVSARARQTAGDPSDLTLLVSLAAPGAPPIMSWRDLAN